MRVLLTGATGFVGTALAPALVGAGHEVVAMTRNPDDYAGPGRVVAGDTNDPPSLDAALLGCDAAYYLVHGLDGSADFADSDAQAARAFGEATARRGLSQIVYLGGLGREGDDLSEHLASRQEVEGRLGQSGVPVTALRAALVVGAGSASFELLRQVVANLPVVVIPPGASTTRVQPISVRDVVRYLVGVLGLTAAVNTVLEVGGPEIVTYEALLHRMAGHQDKDTRSVRLGVIPSLAGKVGVRLLTDIDPQLAVTLLDSLGNDVIVTRSAIEQLLPGPLMTLDEMLEAALRT